MAINKKKKLYLEIVSFFSLFFVLVLIFIFVSITIACKQEWAIADLNLEEDGVRIRSPEIAQEKSNE